MNEESWPLAEAMEARRKELGLRWRDVADEATLSEETIRIVRKGGREKPIRTTDTEAKIERALRWAKGSIQAVRDGGAPVPLPGTAGSTRSHPKRGDLHWSSRPRRRGLGRGYPEFVGADAGYRALWDIPDELLSETERRFAITQIEVLRWMGRT